MLTFKFKALIIIQQPLSFLAHELVLVAAVTGLTELKVLIYIAL